MLRCSGSLDPVQDHVRTHLPSMRETFVSFQDSCVLSRCRVVQIIKSIERRLSYITFLPVENGEGLQILRYEARTVQQTKNAVAPRICA